MIDNLRELINFLQLQRHRFNVQLNSKKIFVSGKKFPHTERKVNFPKNFDNFSLSCNNFSIILYFSSTKNFRFFKPIFRYQHDNELYKRTVYDKHKTASEHNKYLRKMCVKFSSDGKKQNRRLWLFSRQGALASKMENHCDRSNRHSELKVSLG